MKYCPLPRVGDVWKDIWLDESGNVKYVDVFKIITTNVSSTSFNPQKGFIREYIIYDTGGSCKELKFSYNCSLTSFKFRKTILAPQYNSPLWKTLND